LKKDATQHKKNSAFNDPTKTKNIDVMQEKESGDSFIQIKPFKSTAKTTTSKKSQQEKKINNDPRIFFSKTLPAVPH